MLKLPLLTFPMLWDARYSKEFPKPILPLHKYFQKQQR